MERRLVLHERLRSSLMIDLARAAEYRPAELHAALDDARAVVAHDPPERVVCERLGALRLRVEQRDLVEAQADLGVGGVGEVVELAEELDVGGGEGEVGLEAFKEDNWIISISS